MTDIFAPELSSDGSEAWRALLAGAPPPNEDEATEALFDLYGPIAAPRTTPFLIGQLGQSLDGFIAAKTGASHYINGEESLLHLHRLRALCDAVVVGWKTVAADDPQLTVRRAAGKDPLRVVIDMRGMLGPNRRAFSSRPPGALRITGENGPALPGVESETVRTSEGLADPRAIIEILARRGCKRILVEGGGVLVSNFAAAGALDRLHISVAPLLIGEGRRGIALPAAESLAGALRPHCRHYKMGTDMLFDLDLRVG